MDRRRLLLAIAAQSATWKDEAFSPLNGSLAPAKAKGPFKLGKLIGRTLAVNQIAYNGDFSISSGTMGWFMQNGTLSISDKTCMFSPNNIETVYTRLTQQMTNRIKPIQGRWYLIRGMIKSNVNLPNDTFQINLGPKNISNPSIAADTWYYFNEFVHMDRTVPSDVYFSLSIYNANLTGISTYQIFAKNVQIHDLTLMFGPGREPTTVDEFKQVYSRKNTTYTLGQLESSLVAAIIARKTDSTEKSRLTLPNDLTIKSALDAKDTFEVVPKTIGVLNDVSTLITSQTPNANGAVQISVSSLGVKPNTSYIVICNIHIDGFTTTTFSNAYNASIKESIGFVNNVLCIQSDSFIGKTATQIKALLAGKAFYYELETPRSDELAAFTKNVGMVDLGTLTFGMSSSGRFYINAANNISGIKIPTSQDEIADIFCSKYTAINGYQASNFSTNKAMGINPNGYLYIRDDDYSSAADFKTAMAGQYLNYELATPQTITIPLKKLQAVTIGELAWNIDGVGRMSSGSLGGTIKPASGADSMANVYSDCYLTKTVNQTYLRQDGISVAANGRIDIYDSAYSTVNDFVAAHRDDVIWFESVNDQAEWNTGTCEAGVEFETGYVSPDAVLKIYERK